MRNSFVAIALIFLTSASFAQDTSVGDGSTNGDLNTNIGDNNNVDSNNTSTTYNGPQGPLSNPVPTAMAPTVMGGGGNDSCLIPKSRGVQISLFGMAEGSAEQDPECNRRKDARLLGAPQAVGGLGLQVAGISRMCGDPMVFRAMALANTPCPIMDVDTGRLLIGREAFEKYRSNPAVYIVGYAQDVHFWNQLLRIGRKLKDVPKNDDRPSLSDRFRRNSRRTDVQRPSDSGEQHNGPSKPIPNANEGR